MKKILSAGLLILLVGFFSGCATVKLNSTVAPGANLSALKKYYVVHLPKDARGVDRLIADRLNAMGRQATNGEKSAMPADVDAVVTYQDKWMWDITMYMIELTVQVRQPNTDIAIATGHSLRTSLARKSPPEMVEEVLTD
ncbi:MAG TPA: hypothetical protein VM029_17645, partial [Opitutaceae bacterium]|nr:hypothetical protein [Opitutaceae bacterium]